VEQVALLRRQRLTGRRIAGQLGLPVARVHRALRRLAMNRLKSLDAPLPRAAISGKTQAICCTSTSKIWGGPRRPGTASTAIGGGHRVALAP